MSSYCLQGLRNKPDQQITSINAVTTSHPSKLHGLATKQSMPRTILKIILQKSGQIMSKKYGASVISLTPRTQWCSQVLRTTAALFPRNYG